VVTRIVVAMGLILGLCLGPATAVDYVRLSPSEFADDLQKASALAQAQSYEEAVVILRGLVADEPEDADALSLLGYSLRKLGQLDRAEHFYLRALDVEPAHLGANQYLGELYVERGDLEGARVRLEVLEASCGDPCEGREVLAAAIAAAE
jgi:Flp pilus assembly protein TadD